MWCKIDAMVTSRHKEVMGIKDRHRLRENSVPEGWRHVRIEDVIDILDAQRVPLNADVRARMTGDYPYYGANGVVDYIDRWIFDEEELILLAEDGGHFDEYDKRPIAYRVRGKCWVNNHAHVLRAKEGALGPFLFFSLVNKNIQPSINGTTRSKLTQSDLRQIQISVPKCLAEARAIAAVLDSIDEAIERTEAVIAATEQLRDSLLHELLTRGVPGWHTEWKDVPGLGSIPADWEVVRLGDVAAVERGKFAHRPRNEPRFYGGSIPFIQTGDVVQANGRIKEHSQTLNELGLSISRLFPTGTIVITIAANIGETAITDYPVAFPDSLVGIIPTAIDRRFLEYFLRTQKTRLSQFAPESAQKNINLEDLRPLSTPVPSQREQTAIAAALDGVEDLIEQARVERETRQALKVSASEALLTGRVRVKDYNPYPEPGEIVC